MKLLTPMEVAKKTGLPYAKALLVVKNLNHIQIGNRYYISEKALEEFVNTNEPIMIMEEKE